MAMEFIPGPNLVFGTLNVVNFNATTVNATTVNATTVNATAIVAGTVNGVTIDNLPWSAYTPTVSAGVGSFTSINANGRYKQIGKTIILQVQVAVITAGTATAFLIVSLPVSANTTLASAFAGRESATNGSSLAGNRSGSANLVAQFYNATFPAADGMVLNLGGAYEAS